MITYPVPQLPIMDISMPIFTKAFLGGSPAWGKRRLKRFKTVNGKRYQLHATRGWKAA